MINEKINEYLMKIKFRILVVILIMSSLCDGLFAQVTLVSTKAMSNDETCDGQIVLKTSGTTFPLTILIKRLDETVTVR